MLLSLFIIGICLSAIFLIFHRNNPGSAIYLGFFFLLVSIYSLTQYAVLISASVFLTAVFFINPGFLSFLIGPVFYWYFRSVLTDDHRLKKRDLWHFLPAVIFLVASLPYILSPWSEKIHVASLIHREPYFLVTFKATFLHRFFSVAAMFMSRPLHVLIYIILSSALFSRYLRKKADSAVLSRQQFMKKWLLILIGFLILLDISHFLLMFETFSLKKLQIFTTLNVLQVLSVTGLLGLLITPFFFPAILYGLPRLPELYTSTEPVKKSTGFVSDASKKNPLHFESAYLFSIGQKADTCMKELSPYLQTNFSIAQLAVMIQVPVHHLTFYFREEKKQSFSDYKNAWRINYSKNLIRDGKTDDFTLESIGSLSGFTNRNTFLVAFKKFEGISPQTFMTRVKNS